MEFVNEHACMMCYVIWALCFQSRGSFTDVAKVYHENERVRADFDQAFETKHKGGRREFRPSEVSTGSSYNVQIIQHYVGLSRQEYMNLPASQGRGPEVNGHALTDLPNIDGGMFRGVLLQHPERPYTEYQLVHSTMVDNREYAMTQAEQLLPSQPNELFAWAKKQLKARNKFVSKLQNCNLTVDAIDARTRERVEALKLRPDGDEECSDECTNVSMASGSEGASNADSREGSAKLKPKIKETPQKARASVAKASSEASAQGTKSPAGRVRSPGDKPRGSASKGIAECPREIVNRRIAACPIDDILKGRSLGTQVRWARESRAEVRVDAIELDRLNSHIEGAEAAKWIVENNLSEAPREACLAKYKQVQDLDIEWPSELKLTILDQALREKAAAQDVEGFFAACIPWAAPSQLGGNRGAEGNESVEGFSAIDPCLFFADGSPDEKAAHCAASVGTFFQKMASGGEESTTATLDVVARIERFLEKHPTPDEVDHYDSVVDQISVATQCMKCLLDPKTVAHTDSVGAVFESTKHKKNKINSSVLVVLANTLKKNECYNRKWSEFKKYIHQTVELMPQVSWCMEQLRRHPTEVEHVGLDTVLGRSFELLSECHVNMRPGSYDELEGLATKKACERFDALKPLLDDESPQMEIVLVVDRWRVRTAA